MTKSATNISIYYSLFAGLSTVVNINIQMFFILTYKGLYLVEVSILIGTLAGLLLYYFFEKCYIFFFNQQISNSMDCCFILIVSWVYLQQLFSGKQKTYFI